MPTKPSPPRQRGRAVRYNNHYEVPPSSDPRWAGWSQPVLVFITGEKKSWAEIIDWAKETKVGLDYLRELLGWLALAGKAECVKQTLEDGTVTVHWRSVDADANRKIPKQANWICKVCKGILKTEDFQSWRCVLCARSYVVNRAKEK